jgi:hypothetical protein
MGGGRHSKYFSHNLSVRSKAASLALGGCRSRQGGRKSAVLFGEFVLVSKKEIYRLNHNIVERLRRNRDRLQYILGYAE